jgi:tight adherence protein B
VSVAWAPLAFGVAVFALTLACGAAIDGAARASRREPVLRRLMVGPPLAPHRRNRRARAGRHPGAARVAGTAGAAEAWLRRWARALRAIPTHVTRRRHDVDVVRCLPAAVDGIARSLRAGSSVRLALAEAAAAAPAALGRDLGLVVRAGDQGIPLREAIERWSVQRPLPAVRLTAAALVLGVDAGAGLARSLDGVASTLYERAAIEREVRALSTQARYSAGVLAIAPLIFLGVVALIEPATTSFLVGTPAGLACLAAGLAFDLTGGWWMARITRLAT